MVVFEGKAFDEKRVISIDTREGSWSNGVKNRYSVIMTFDNETTITWDRYTHDTAISKVSEIAYLMNKREEELLKLKAN